MKNAIFILSVFMREEHWPVNCKGRKTRKLKRRFQHLIYFSSSEHMQSGATFLKPVSSDTKVVHVNRKKENLSNWFIKNVLGIFAIHQSVMSLNLSTFQSWKKANKYLTIDSSNTILTCSICKKCAVLYQIVLYQIVLYQIVLLTFGG